MSFQKNYAKIVAKAWSDPKFKEQLLKNPEAVLKEQGIEIPKGTKIKIHENTEDTMNFVLPKMPSEKLSEKDLESLAAGDLPNCGSSGSRCYSD